MYSSVAERLPQADFVIRLDVSSSSNFDYTLWSNNSLSNQGGIFNKYAVSGRRLAAQNLLERSIVLAAAGKTAGPADVPSLRVSRLPAPTATSTSAVDSASTIVSGHDDFSQIAVPTAVQFAGLLVGLLVFYIAIEEKQEKLVGVMRVMGTLESAYWGSWVVTFFLVALLAGLAASIVLAPVQWPVFERMDFSVLLVPAVLFFWAMCCVGLFLGAVVSVGRANIFAFMFLLVALLVTGFVPTTSVYQTSTNPGIQLIVFFNPWLHMSKITSDWYRLTDRQVTLDATTGLPTVVAGKFTWADVYDTVPYSCEYTFSGPFQLSSSCTDTRSTNYVMGLLVSNVIVYAILAWYFAQVSTDGVGTAKPTFFPFMPSFWGLRSGNNEVFAGDTLSEEQRQSQQRNSVRVHKLSKSFREVNALKEITLEMEFGEIFVVLGHNGAGKSTLINILSGLMAPTFGSAFAFGANVSTERELVQAVSGTW